MRYTNPERPVGHDERRLAVLASVCVQTIRRAYAGLPIRTTTAARIARAARVMRLSVPPSCWGIEPSNRNDEEVLP